MTATVAPRTYLPTTGVRGLRFVPALALASDLAVVSLTMLAALAGRAHLAAPEAGYRLDIGQHLTIAGPAIVAVWIATIALAGGYRLTMFGAGVDEYKAVIRASLFTSAVVGIGCYLMRFQLSRGFFLLLFVVGIPLLAIARYALRSAVHKVRERGYFQHRVVIAGSGGHVDEIASVLNREKWLGYDVVGAVLPHRAERDTTALGVPLLGATGSLAQIAKEVDADIVFLAGGAFDCADDVRSLAWEIEHESVEVVIAPSVTDVAAERVRIRPVGGLPLIHLEKPRSAAAVRRAKRTFDVVCSLGLLVVLSPLIAYVAARIWLHDQGPVLFRQPRVGRDGKVFECLKFRTMVVDAEDRLASLHEEVGYAGGLFKLPEDPRVTRPGRWLRRHSVDEVPQLVNVLRGDMSLVGPRPPLEHEVEQYDDMMARRLRVRPGMTGLWQVSGRSDLAWSEAIRLDLYYVDNWSMVQDLTILLRTLRVVLRPNGAY